MKTRLFTLMGLVVVASMLIAACGGAATTAAPPAGEAKLKVVLLLNGVQGDKSFFDSAVRGVKQAEQEFGIQLKIIEAGIDPAKWQPALEDAAANEDYDMLIVGTFQMTEYLQTTAPKYPDKKFVIFDAPVDYTLCECKNVYSVSYKQNEGSYLAGLYAGLMTQSSLEGMNAELKSTMVENDQRYFTRFFTPPIRLMAAIAFLVGALVVGIVLYSATVERQREYGVLKAIGARGAMLYRVTLAQAFLVTVAGSLIGVAVALGSSELIMEARPQFLIAYAPETVAAALAAGGVMALLATFLPARVIAATAPAEVFRR